MKQRLVVATLLTLVSRSPLWAQHTISTLAGGGPPENTPALSLGLWPTGVANDSAGNLYVLSQNRVFKIDSLGNTTVAAGTGLTGYSGDGGPAASAKLNHPQGLAVDKTGNLYIADGERVRKVSDGIITTVAGNGQSGDAGDGGAATDSQVAPVGVAVDGAGSIYITTSWHTVRKVTGGVITRLAGTRVAGYSGDGGPATSAQLSYPSGVAVDTAGDVYIADSWNLRIRKVSGGVITTVAGGGIANPGDGGQATSAMLSSASGVCVDGVGNLYVAEGNRVRKVSGGVITTVAGSGTGGYAGDGGPATNAALNGVRSVTVDNAGSLFVADHFNYRVRKVATGVINTIAGNGRTYSGDGGPATGAQLSASAVATDSTNSVFFIDQFAIRKVTGSVISTAAGNGTLGGDTFYSPSGLAVDGSGNIYFADITTGFVRKSSSGGITIVAGGGMANPGDGGPATGARLSRPSGVAVDGSANLYITEGNRVRKVSGGVITTLAGDGNCGFSGDGGPAGSAQVCSPGAIAVDGTGALYFSDRSNNRVRKIAGGVITTVAGGGTVGVLGDGGPATSAYLLSPGGLSLDGVGNLFIADASNNRVRRVSGGVITTIAGNGSAGFSGDGGPATNAELNSPNDVAVDSAGAIFVADSGNLRIRRLTPVQTAPVTLTTVPAGRTIVVDGTSFTAPQTFAWALGATHAMSVDELQAGATGARYAYSSWSDGGARSHTITVPGSGATYTATFTTQYLLTRTSPGGTIAANPGSPDGYYAGGASVQLTAAASAGFLFTGWSGDLTGSANPQWVTMNGPRTVTANFAPVGAVTSRIGFFRQGMWLLDYDASGGWGGPATDRLYWLGQAGDTPLVGDWNGDGRSEIAFFRAGMWLLDYNGNGSWDGPAVDRLYWLGQVGDVPLVGDWNGDGKDEIGFFRAGMWLLDHNGDGAWSGHVIDRLYWLGQAGDTPLVGDWNGDGKPEIGFFRAGMWLLDYNGDGAWSGHVIDRLYWLGQAGDTPLIGDWNGDGKPEIGFFRAGMWLLDYNGDGAWSGHVIDRLYWLGQAGDTPLVADWNSDGRAEVGLFRAGMWLLDFNGNGWWDSPQADRLYWLGQLGDLPLMGRW